MLSRIRVNLKDDDANFDDFTQVDETYVGGKGKKGQQGRSLKKKTPVMGLLSAGLVHARVIPNTTKKFFKQLLMNLYLQVQ